MSTTPVTTTPTEAQPKTGPLTFTPTAIAKVKEIWGSKPLSPRDCAWA
jgi:hypothetical protein